ncbi:tyrosine-type recombinase/integrase [Caviibacterium pharyngocola]|uniref:Preprotein translocase n=1 Tax=Caviibacterium pharyngocola TaxID=28159 RepID=A0A2M8RTI0_9PAST|nr:integrase arm-type DNA-binding domain-containing protein [Caviibacterium pharyngocola]PJG82164.1 preprotein translocase [Caviibacterium pharyngocola]
MPKITKQLTDTEIKKAKPQEKDITLTDGNGLFLLILPSGAKSWRFNYLRPISKKRTKITLGTYPEITLAQAREKREEYRALLAQGIDPQVHRDQIKQAEQKQQEDLFISVAEKWKLKKAREIEELTLKKNWRRLETYVFPVLGEMPVSEILPKVVIDMLNPLQDKSDTLKRTIRLINEILNYAVNYGLLTFNPCSNVKEVFTFEKSKPNPTIRPEEVPELIYKINNSTSNLFNRCLMKFTLLTLTRTVESSGAKWSEFDFDKKTWTVPAERMKTRKKFTIPLSTQVLRIIEILKTYKQDETFVFYSSRAKDNTSSKQNINKILTKLGYKNLLTGHGLRSIGSTYLNEYEPFLSPDAVEACLSHGIKDQVRKAYNRSDYLEQRRKVMQVWGDYIEQCEKSYQPPAP